MSLGVISVGALPPGSPHRASIKREMIHFQSLRERERERERETLCLQNTLLLSLKSLVKELPLPWSPIRAPVERDAMVPEPMVYSFIHISQESPVKELSHETRKHLVTIHRTGWKACVQWGAVWFPKVIIYDTAITTPVSCSLQHNTFQVSVNKSMDLRVTVWYRRGVGFMEGRYMVSYQGRLIT